MREVLNMECKINDLYELQEALDDRIFEQHGVTRADTMTRRQLALLVEISELANETRCFKSGRTKDRVLRMSSSRNMLTVFTFCYHLGSILKTRASHFPQWKLKAQSMKLF